MVRAVLFDLFETLVTQCRTQPPGVASLAPRFGCERAAFRTRWKALRPDVMAGRVSFRQALSDIATSLGGHAEDATLLRTCADRVRLMEEPFTQIESPVIGMLDHLRSRGLRLGVVSNCVAEDVTSWSRCSLAARVDSAVFSFEAGLAKPDPEIYVEATRRLGIDVSETWFIGDGGDGELAGAEQAGLRSFKATWFLKRWPHFVEAEASASSMSTVEDFVTVVEQSLEVPEDGIMRPTPARPRPTS